MDTGMQVHMQTYTHTHLPGTQTDTLDLFNITEIYLEYIIFYVALHKLAVIRKGLYEWVELLSVMCNPIPNVKVDDRLLVDAVI